MEFEIVRVFSSDHYDGLTCARMTLPFAAQPDDRAAVVRNHLRSSALGFAELEEDNDLKPILDLRQEHTPHGKPLRKWADAQAARFASQPRQLAENLRATIDTLVATGSAREENLAVLRAELIKREALAASFAAVASSDANFAKRRKLFEDNPPRDMRKWSRE